MTEQQEQIRRLTEENANLRAKVDCITRARDAALEMVRVSLQPGTKEVRAMIGRSLNGNIIGPAEDDLHDICARLCDLIDGLDCRIRRLEG